MKSAFNCISGSHVRRISEKEEEAALAPVPYNVRLEQASLAASGGCAPGFTGQYCGFGLASLSLGQQSLLRSAWLEGGGSVQAALKGIPLHPPIAPITVQAVVEQWLASPGHPRIWTDYYIPADDCSDVESAKHILAGIRSGAKWLIGSVDLIASDGTQTVWAALSKDRLLLDVERRKLPTKASLLVNFESPHNPSLFFVRPYLRVVRPLRAQQKQTRRELVAVLGDIAASVNADVAERAWNEALTRAIRCAPI